MDTAIEALPHLPDEARLELIGGWDTHEEDRLRELARELGVEGQVGFGGHRDRPEILRAYADCDAVIFPVRWEEPWGLVPLEAMGKGRPVVATGRGGSGEYLRDGENCVLFEAGDAESLADALRRLASDAELRRRLYDGGLETAARYTEPLYNEAVEHALLEAADRAVAWSAWRTLRRKARSLVIKVVYFRAPLIASALRKRWAKFKNPTATIEFGKHTYCGPGFSLHMPFGGTFITGEGVEFRRRFRAETGKDGRIEIGAGSYLTYDVIISCDTTIKIGERCGLAQSTYVADGSHKYKDLDEEFLNQGYNYRPIVIADDAQIHSKCTIVNSIGHRVGDRRERRGLT